MSDQADALRELVRARSGPAGLPGPAPPHATSGATPRRAMSVVFTSGKGGVGTSNLCLNLAIALGQAGQRVVLVDADFGLANLDLLCGLAPERDLGDVLADDRPMAEAVVPGPAGIRIVAGAHGMRTLAEALEAGPDRLVAELSRLEGQADFLLIDAGSGLGTAAATLAPSADQVVVVTTPEPTAVADAHAAIRHLRRAVGLGATALRAAVTQARSTGEANDVLARLSAASREFLGVVVEPLGQIRFDPQVPRAVRMRRPFLLAAPHGPASRCVRRLARTLVDERRPEPRRPGFFASLATRKALRRAVVRQE